MRGLCRHIMFRLSLSLILLLFANVALAEALLSLDEYEADSAELAIDRHRLHAERVRRAAGDDSDMAGRIDGFMNRLDLEAGQLDDLRRGNTPTPEIARGQHTAKFPTVGALLYNRERETTCSGTLVGQASFLTARHCFEGSQDPGDYEVYLQHGGIFGVTGLEFPDDAELDLAILTLDRRVTGIAPSQLPEAFATATRFVRLVGFGVTAEGASNSGIKRYGGNITTTCPDGDDQFICLRLDAPYEPIGTESNPCSRDSGGPVGAGSEVDLQVIEAVAIRVPPEFTCQQSSVSWSLAVHPQIDWIDEHVAQQERNPDPSLPVCCDGAVAVSVREGMLPKSGKTIHDWTFEVPAQVGVIRVSLNAADVPGSDLDLSVRQAAVTTNVGASLHQPRPCVNLGRYETCEYHFSSAPPKLWAARVEHTRGSSTIYQLVVTMFERR